MKLLWLIVWCLCVQSLSAQQVTIPQLIKQVENSVFTVFALDDDGEPFSQGSGFFISSSGIGITNYHVLDGASNAIIKNKNGKIFKIKNIIDYNSKMDLVKFQVESTQIFSFSPLAKQLPTTGESILNLSSPLGLEQTVSNGIISSIRQVEPYGNVIQITAPISHGSSGSPIFNNKGEVIGIATYGIEGGQNLNFAVSNLEIIKLNHNQNVPVKALTKNPWETKNIRTAKLEYLARNYYNVISLLKNEFTHDTTNHLALYWLGNAYYELGEYSTAIPILSKAIELDHNNVEYFLALGKTFAANGYQKKGDIESFQFAHQCYELALQIDPNNPTAYYNIGHMIYESVHTYHILNQSALYEAMKALNNAIELNPSYEVAYITRATAKISLEDYWSAISDCDKAIDINPYYYRSYAIRGEIKSLRLNDQQSGIIDLNKALALVNNNNSQMADILGIRAFTYAYWAQKLITPSDVNNLLNKAISDFEQAYKISNDVMYLDKLNQLKQAFNN